MAEIISARGKGEKMIRLTLFPPSGERVVQLIKEKYHYEDGVLSYTDTDGIEYETSLPFAIEHIREGHQKAPFSRSEK